jgi:AcrR family transcriptional regulator
MPVSRTSEEATMVQRQPAGPSLRDRIVAGAVEVIRQRGTVGATTKEIARAAGVSEGSLYNHFTNKSELIAAAMAEVTSGIREATIRLRTKVGHGEVADNLTEFAMAAMEFYGELLPIAGPILGDRELLEWLRRSVPTGPARGSVQGLAALAEYMDAERQSGRLAATVSPPHLAAVLLGACQQYAFLTLMADPWTVTAGTGLATEPLDYARQIVRTLLTAQLGP